jgi:hypothetical protein
MPIATLVSCADAATAAASSATASVTRFMKSSEVVVPVSQE